MTGHDIKGLVYISILPPSLPPPLPTSHFPLPTISISIPPALDQYPTHNLFLNQNPTQNIFIDIYS